MIRPECEQILSLAEEYQIIPVCKEIYADMMTPISMLLRLSAVGERYFCLRVWRAAKSGDATLFSAVIRRCG